ncbi:MAG: tRNA preQ1(34) S-adenosylmethionine ribosyltransferase-isomerase QueA [bacterium]|nr:tRNA preQ1(34) S-adenosylmethionine ribosyltransferase-isomerase QueA [bacterium]
MTLNPEKYDLDLPEGLIAKEPAVPRDRAQLLVYNKKENKIFWDTFLNIDKYLPKDSVLVFNETKVLPARIILNKETGGRVEILYLNKKDNLIKVLADRELKIGSALFLKDKKMFETIRQDKNIYWLKPVVSGDVFKIFERYGIMPIPPYIKNTTLSEGELRKKYQAVFAKNLGSSAAPTASLHFTNRLLEKLKRLGFDIRFITLHVGLGTFAPLTEENIKKGKLHKEYYEIDEKTFSFLRKSKERGRPVVAVGTTVARALEAGFASPKPPLGGAKAGGFSGETDLFIWEGYKFKAIDGLVTNFHLPKSSLLMLVSAFMGRENVLKCYKKAIEKKLKFYSFGDGMLIV